MDLGSLPRGTSFESDDPTSCLLELTGLSRSFGETRALVSASLAVKPGEIHALVGENGSGKSTLIKILSGVLQADSGEIRWEGRLAHFHNPVSAQSAGISTVFQETLVVPELSIRDNIFLGADGVFRHKRSGRDEQLVAAQALNELGIEGLDLNRSLWALSLAERQLVTIARAIVRPWRLLILDEATSALDATQRDRLFAYLRRARTEGRSVVFTSHRMDEVTSLAETVSVLRFGETVAHVPMAETSPRQVLVLMAGRQSVERTLGVSEDHRLEPQPVSLEDTSMPVLRIQDLVLRRDAPTVTLTVAKGEILGLAGLEGQGQVDLAECICGLRRPSSGAVLVTESSGTWHAVRNFGDANRRGIAYVPRDRKQEGLFAPLSTFDNFSLALIRQFNRVGVIRRSIVRRSYGEYAELLHLQVRRAGDPVVTLSGGNQQKVLLGRWLSTRPQILVMNDPLRGVDANTKEELYGLFRKLAADGLAIVLVSTEILELLTLCDRIAVMFDGGLQAVLPAARTTDTDVVAAMFGHGIEPSPDD